MTDNPYWVYCCWQAVVLRYIEQGVEPLLYQWWLSKPMNVLSQPLTIPDCDSCLSKLVYYWWSSLCSWNLRIYLFISTGMNKHVSEEIKTCLSELNILYKAIKKIMQRHLFHRDLLTSIEFFYLLILQGIEVICILVLLCSYHFKYPTFYFLSQHKTFILLK